MWTVKEESNLILQMKGIEGDMQVGPHTHSWCSTFIWNGMALQLEIATVGIIQNTLNERQKSYAPFEGEKDEYENNLKRKCKCVFKEEEPRTKVTKHSL